MKYQSEDFVGDEEGAGSIRFENKELSEGVDWVFIGLKYIIVLIRKDQVIKGI